jgi:hypothetical protein
MSRFLRSVAATWLLLAVWPASASEFLAGFDDLPVMPGLAAVDGAGIVFDTPAGRIIEGYAAGKVTEEAVRSFYGKTLPQLGWTRVAKDEFRREGEHLKMEFKGEDRTLTVRFTLSPGKNANRGG